MSQDTAPKVGKASERSVGAPHCRKVVTVFRFRSLHAAHLSIIACLALSPAAYAQTAEKPTAAQIKEAKKEASEAAKLIKKKQYAEALPKLQSAYAVDPTPATLAQIGLCQRELGQLVEAYATFDALKAHEKATAKDKKNAEKNLEELAKLTGLVRVTVSEADATVSLDGKALGAEQLASAIRVHPGKHTVAVTKEGFESFQQEFEVAGGGEANIEAKLVAEVKTARVRVAEKDGKEVRVFIDGKEVGPAPWEGELDPGQHTIEVRGSNVASPKETIEVAAKQKVELELDASVLQGSVKVTAQPAEAIVLIDGNQVTLPFEGNLDVGTHRIEVSAPGYEPVTREIVVTADQPAVEEFVLTAVGEQVVEESGGRIVKPGILLGIGFLRPSGEIAVKITDYVAVGGQYSMLPEFDIPGFDAKVGTSAIQGTLRVFPFGGAFYVGAAGGLQTLKVSKLDDDTKAEVDFSSPVVTPQVGWLWTWDSGFTIGLSLGAQIPFGKDPEVKSYYNGIEIPEDGPAPAGVPQEKADSANKTRGKVKDVAKLIGKTPLPQIDLLKIGFFF